VCCLGRAAHEAYIASGSPKGYAVEGVAKLGGRIPHCLNSAYHHLRRSWTLQPIDSEMSLFRAITADEEAATVLTLALKHSVRWSSQTQSVGLCAQGDRIRRADRYPGGNHTRGGRPRPDCRTERDWAGICDGSGCARRHRCRSAHVRSRRLDTTATAALALLPGPEGPTRSLQRLFSMRRESLHLPAVR